jgi:arginine decarboxylase
MGLRDLCQHVHELYAKYDIARLTTDMYLSELTPAMNPADAYACIARRQVERVEIDQLEGRITVALVTPYPPGIPLLIPGEVFNRKIVDYLKFAREFARMPGLRDRHPRPGRGRGRPRPRALLRRLRGQPMPAACALRGL